MDIEAVHSKVQGPAMGLLATAVLGFLAMLGNLAWSGFSAATTASNLSGADPDIIVSAIGSYVGGACFSCFALIIGGVILFGALKMKNLQSYNLALAASVLAAIPCLSPCCLIGLPVGIWSIVTLMDEDVKAAFQSGGMQM